MINFWKKILQWWKPQNKNKKNNLLEEKFKEILIFRKTISFKALSEKDFNFFVKQLETQVDVYSSE